MSQSGSESDDHALSQASLEYLSNIEPEETWDRRGYRGHSMNYRETQRWYTTKQSRLKKQVKNGRLPGDREAFRADVARVFNRLKQNPGHAVRSLFPDQRFLFVVGMPRTGGTYLLKETLNVQGDQLKSYDDRMIHDGLPLREQLIDWNQSDYRESLLFEFSQLFVWMRREMDHLDWIPKKRISLVYALPLVDDWFGERASYWFTVRHPGPVAQSWAEAEGLNQRPPNKKQREWARRLAEDPEATAADWEAVSYRERVLRFWCHYYRIVDRARPLKGRAEFVGFGPDQKNHVREFAGELGVDHQPGRITPVDRSLDEWWDEAPQVARIRETLSRLGSPELRRSPLP